jgi:fructokinase
VNRPLDVIAIGEVLWDIIGAERHLGGAPFNFAVHCHNLGARSAMISRVGQDALGDEVLARARELGVDGSLIQRDGAHPTGQVQVTLDAAGQPAFDICTGAAYDYLAAAPEALARVRAADVICFGTLAQRQPAARAAIAALLEAASAQALVVCDLNLRPPHYTVQVVRESLARCRALKLNDDELRAVQEMLGRGDLGEDEFLLHLLDAYGLALVCVTRGARGCLLRTHQERVAAPGYACRVVDTVGSGDAFAAALVVKHLAGEPLAQVADFANRVGGYVATQPGATPPVTPEALAAFARSCRVATLDED